MMDAPTPPRADRLQAHHGGRHRFRTSQKLVAEPFGLERDSLPRPLDWIALFGNDASVEMEIGIGRGAFLTEQARARPHVNFVGVEWSRPFWRFASDRLRRHECVNARCVHGEALSILREWVQASSLRAIHLYFPDPWPKKRHHKRRLVQAPFIAEVERVLVPRGRLQVLTDHREYFEQIEGVLSGSALVRADFESESPADRGELVGTNFERKYRRQGRAFYAVAAVRPAS